MKNLKRFTLNPDGFEISFANMAANFMCFR